jgi:initiation factor 1A
MPRNLRGGNKAKKGKNNSNKEADPQEKIEIPFSTEENMLYATVNKRLGGKYVEALCSDKELRKAHIPGSFYKRVWFNAGDYILVQLRDCFTNNNICDILYKYSDEEVIKLKGYGEIQFGQGVDGNKASDEVIFEYDEKDDIEFESI